PCGDLLRRLKGAGGRSVGPYGFGYPVPMAPGAAEDRAAAPAPGAPAAPGAATTPEHSTTNVQEAGVDEPDTVKTDGRRIVVVAGGRLRGVDAATRRGTGSLALAQGGRYAPTPR